MESNAGGTKRGLYHEGYNYGVKNKEKTRYGCIKYGCARKLRIAPNHDPKTIELYGPPHTCMKSKHKTPEEKELAKTLNETVRDYAETGTSAKLLFDDISLQHREVAGNMSYSKMQKTMQKNKNSGRSKTGVKKQYASLATFKQHIEQYPFLLTFSIGGKEVSVEAHLVESSTKGNHMILYDPQLLHEFDNENELFVDATFKIVPDIKGVTQVLTLMCKKYNTVVPCMWVLMTRKTTKSYKSIWAAIGCKFPFFKPQRCICDYEKALMRSLRESFKGTHVRGCYFHFTQAIIRKAKSKKYRLYLSKQNKIKNPQGHAIITKILLIALLPWESAREAVEIILSEVVATFKDDLTNLAKWKKFITVYFENEWMKKVKPKVFSVYWAVDRTNNYLESYHRSLHQLLRTSPSTFTFMYAIVKLKENSILLLERAKKKIKNTVGPKAEWKLRDETIKNAWMELRADPPWTVEKFLNDLASYDDQQIFELTDQIDAVNGEADVSSGDSDNEEEDDNSDYVYDSEKENAVIEARTDNNETVEETKTREEKVDVTKTKNSRSTKRKSQLIKKETSKKVTKRVKIIENEDIQEEKKNERQKRIIKKKKDQDFCYSF